MIGVSLPLDWLINGEGLSLDVDHVLTALKSEGVKSVELRTVREHHSAFEVRRVADRLWDCGFQISLHGSIKTAENAVTELFTPIAEVLKNLRQPTVNITVHAVVGDNVKMLTDVADYIEQNGLPVTVALENNRLMPDKSEGDSATQVLSIVKAVNRKCIGICWDMGHYMYWCLKNHPDKPDNLPDKEFLKRVIHTHIHALSGLKTHFPLDSHNLPLKRFLDALCFEYFGLYNIELEHPRFKGVREPLEAFVGSVRELQAQMPICAKLYDEVRENFDNWFTSALTALNGTEKGTKFSLIHSSSYLFNTNGYRWGMDIAFRNARFLASTPKRAVELLKDLNLMIISHGHRDHFEESTTRELAQTKLEWVIPDFLYDVAIERGISPDRMHIATEGQPLTVGELTILPFKGRHYRAGTDKGVPEYGYYITAKDSPSLVFPVDVRDLSLENLPNTPKADYCFANVWMGDYHCLDTDYAPLDRDFAEFMLQFSDKNILLTHLNEDGRKDKEMWRDFHAAIVTKKLNELSPDTKVQTPHRGEVITLT